MGALKKKLLISFSGGRTSGYMMYWLTHVWEERHNWSMVVVFANTGKEAEGTLEFVDRCSKEWNIPIVWVEAHHKDFCGNWYSKKGWKVFHQVVTFETAARNGEPFEEMLSVLGIPSTNAPFCSAQLKRIAIESYMKRIGWKNYYKAIGIRADEVDRMNEHYKELKIVYPFIKGGLLGGGIDVMKPDTYSFWDGQSFDLDIDPDEGNCIGCWKKDLPRLVRIAEKNPTEMDWWQDMTDKYGHLNPRKTDLKPPYNFYRGNLSPKDIRALISRDKAELQEYSIDHQLSGCGESCEAF